MNLFHWLKRKQCGTCMCWNLNDDTDWHWCDMAMGRSREDAIRKGLLTRARNVDDKPENNRWLELETHRSFCCNQYKRESR